MTEKQLELYAELASRRDELTPQEEEEFKGLATLLDKQPKQIRYERFGSTDPNKPFG